MPLTHFRPRGDIKANWTAANPILKQREMGIEWEKEIGKGPAKIKIGNGTTAWNSLGYGFVDDITQKTINSFVATTGNNALSVGDTIAKAAGKLNAQRDYWMTLTGSARAQAFFDSLNNLSNDDFVGVMEWLNSNKIDTSLRYGGLDSSNNNQVLTAPAGKQLKQLCDNNATEISKLNSNFTSIEPKHLTACGAFLGTITRNTSMVSGKQVTLSLTIAAPVAGIPVDVAFFYINGRLKPTIIMAMTGNFVVGYLYSNITEVGDTVFYIRTAFGAVPANTELFLFGNCEFQ